LKLLRCERLEHFRESCPIAVAETKRVDDLEHLEAGPGDAGAAAGRTINEDDSGYLSHLFGLGDGLECHA